MSTMFSEIIIPFFIVIVSYGVMYGSEKRRYVISEKRPQKIVVIREKKGLQQPALVRSASIQNFEEEIVKLKDWLKKKEEDNKQKNMKK